MLWPWSLLPNSPGAELGLFRSGVSVSAPAISSSKGLLRPAIINLGRAAYAEPAPKEVTSDFGNGSPATALGPTVAAWPRALRRASPRSPPRQVSFMTDAAPGRWLCVISATPRLCACISPGRLEPTQDGGGISGCNLARENRFCFGVGQVRILEARTTEDTNHPLA